MALDRLLKGFADFRLGYYREHLDLFEKLATEGQSPKILIIGCADARVDPGILTPTRPGGIFTVRTIAATVPAAQLPPAPPPCAAASPRWSMAPPVPRQTTTICPPGHRSRAPCATSPCMPSPAGRARR